MFALHDPGVTAGAAQPMAPLHLTYVCVVIEKDVILEDHFPVGKPLRMTSLLETNCVVHFRSRSGVIGVGNILQYIGRYEGCRIWMTCYAPDVAMRGSLPLLVVRLDVMANGAGLRAVGCPLYRNAGENQDYDQNSDDLK
jgi:hypothetical protein